MSTTHPAPLRLRPMMAGDIPHADGIRARVGWNQVPADWYRLLQLTPQGCFVAEQDRIIVGTVTTTIYDSEVGWIGMLLVDPNHRRQGIGSRLLQQAVTYLRSQGVVCIALDATPAGEILYARMGFQPHWSLSRWSGNLGRENDSIPSGVAVCQAAPLVARDWASVIRLDRQAFGVDRSSLLRVLEIQSRRTQVVVDADGEIQGFGMVRPGDHAWMIGPLVASGPALAYILLVALCADLEDPRLCWDIPEPNRAARALASRLGFVRQRPLTRMALGRPLPPHTPALLYGIADLATG